MVSAKALEESTILVVSAFLASVVAYLSSLVPEQSLAIAEVLGVFSLVLIALVALRNVLSQLIWKVSMKWRLQRPVFGILRQDGCKSAFTSFTPNDWEEHLRHQGIGTEFIEASAINDKFSVLINPYGEVYPEEELLTLRTFERIKRYIWNGGIFVCAGGIAFFYGGDLRSPPRAPPLADELDVFVPRPQGGMIPSRTYPPTYSLTSTLLQKSFGVVTTWRDTERDKCHQTGTERRFVGDIANVGNINEVLHFRAVREPVRRCLPFLRVSPVNWVGDVYVIAGIPYGKGCLVVCGFDLTDNPNSPLWNPQIHTANIEKICHAVKNLVENRKRGNIPLNAEYW